VMERLQNVPVAMSAPSAGRWRDYLAVARPDHWFKNLFMVAGTAAAVVYTRRPMTVALLGTLALAFAATCCIASFNYIINEILDARTDRNHPRKRHRPIPSGRVRLGPLFVLAGGFLGAGLAIGLGWFSMRFLLSLVSLFLMGLVYNVPPVRSKDLPFIDALSESVNNPIRLCIGWFAVEPLFWPPSSLLVAYWALGGFLMTAKRYAEYVAIGDVVVASAYRKSFRYYSERSLLIAMIVYISCFMSMYGVLAAKYQTELLVALPFLAIFIAWFFHLAFEADSIVQEPERIVHKPGFLLYCAGLFGLIVLLAAMDFSQLVAWLGLPNIQW